MRDPLEHSRPPHASPRDSNEIGCPCWLVPDDGAATAFGLLCIFSSSNKVQPMAPGRRCHEPSSSLDHEPPAFPAARSPHEATRLEAEPSHEYVYVLN